ncbi:EamA family transporter RarD [Vibrio sp. ZSDZ34]|jgi:chloramphenicol-sensitive protein RarD|uniref:EamA family transporter RarD n=1 Tax=Vibrio gelatinilyticus TaxID=2893468 RepID=A0A9X1WB82_9VIBR|nr:EamA family transporter RarD [Vibrio gelatinilyticus]MCJ2376911.1 EamA family transporter RarD [Vibrio gelatinilyticus]
MTKKFHQLSGTAKGVLASIVASCLFGFLPLYVQFQPQLLDTGVAGGEGHWIASQRIVWSCVLMLFVLAFTRKLPLLIKSLSQFNQWPRYLLSGLLVGPQFWIFVWAPLYDETLSVALGYFSLPLVLVVVGKVVYGEKLSRLQTVACFIAAFGVAYAYIMAEGLSWIVLLIALGYPLYFIHRKSLNLGSDIGFTLDNLFLLPIALGCIFYLQPMEYIVGLDSPVWLFYIGLAIAGTTPMLLFLYASQALPMSIFGLLGYVEPMLVFIVGLLLGERVEANEWPTYVLIMLALIVLALDGIRRARTHGAIKVTSA